jgi:chemosensory pili system protein ChpA (sensor histidine kinase/response regulator)
MQTTPPDALAPAPESGDVEQLSWVLDEVHASLAEASGCARAFLANKDDAARLRSGRDLLHQVAGALQLLELKGGAALASAGEQLFARWDSQPGECLPGSVRSFDSAMSALRAWLEGRAAGATTPPLRLFPAYREVLELAHAERIHPADLLFPDLTRRTPYGQITEDGPLGADRLRVARARFEQGLLAFLRSPDEPASRRQLCDAVVDIEMLPQRGMARSFWWAARGLFEALDAFGLPVDEEFKRFLARLNQQLQRQIEGGPAVSERLFTEALFHVSRSGPGIERADAVRRLYRLDELAPRDYAESASGAPDIEARRTLQDAIRQVKVLWGQLAASGRVDTTRLAAELERARAAASRLDALPAARVLACIASVGADATSASPVLREALAMEVATALLLLEARAEDPARPDPRFAERADALIERIERAASGLGLAPAADWIAGLAREAQERVSLGAVVGETRGALHEIEMRLDRYFRAPADRRELAALPPLFDQIGGVLGVLGFADAEGALRHVQRWVRAQADPASVADSAHFPDIAQSLGALGFFLSTLSQQPIPPPGMFSFDAQTGVFTAHLGEPRPRPAEEPAFAAAEAAAAAGAPAAAGPDGGKGAGPDGVRAGAPPPELDASRDETIESGASPDLEVENIERSTERMLETVLECANGLVARPEDTIIQARLSPILVQLSADADLLDNASLKRRVLDGMHLLEEIARSGSAHAAQQLRDLFRPATTPRPALPTSAQAADRELLEVFVEEADEVLEAIGRQLARLRADPADGALLTMTRRAFHTLKGSSRMVGLDDFGGLAWAVEQCCNVRLAQERGADEDLLQIASVCADRMRDWIEALRAAGEGQPGPDFDASGLIEAARLVRDGGAFRLPLAVEAPAAAQVAAGAKAAAPTPQAPESDAARSIPLRMRDDRGDEDETVRIGPVVISHGLYTVFLGEADECSRALVQDVGEWRYEPMRAPQQALVRRAHTLAGISQTVGLEPLTAIADPLDLLFQHLYARLEEPGAGAQARADAPWLAPSQFDVLERALERVRGMLHQFAAGIYPDAAPLEAGALQDLLAIQRAQDESRTAGAADDIDPQMLQVFTIEASELLPSIGAGLRALGSDPGQRAIARELMRHLHTLKGSARMAGVMRMGELVHGMETRIEAAMQLPSVPRHLVEELQSSHDDAMGLFEQLRSGSTAPLEPLVPLEPLARPAPRPPLSAPPPAPSAPASRPAPGAAPAGPAAPSVPAAFAPPDIPASLAVTPPIAAASKAGVGSGSTPVPSPTAREAAPPPMRPVSAPPAAEPPAGQEAAAPSGAAPPEEARPPTAAGSAFIRVRADIVDRMVDHAGEVAISRSRIESGVESMRGATSDLAENIQRLRGQLRELEMHADAQFQARSDQAAKQSSGFDPLEFDRYSRLQELAKQMLESVEDVALVQGGLARNLQSAEQDLTAQSRLTRELQQQLMRVRLVPFGNISERLHRVARQASRELGRRVQLDLRGGTTEIDRGVLEQMAGAFEHLVRNGVVHGIEAPERRDEAGKVETGEILIDVRHEGNEVVVTVSDDGAGLDLERLRERGIEAGLLAPGSDAGERELCDLIFAPGISTATEITELAGRGVGLDVVREQVNAVGGRITVATRRGRGTRFTIYLPMSLSILQVVIAHVGARRYALPAAMIEQIRRVRPQALQEALARGSLDFGPAAGEVTLRALAQLVGERVSVAPARQHSVALLHLGDDRLAVSIDELSANQEVVVKGVGPQVARLPGILGATVLGDGQVVLILNPVQLLPHAPEPSIQQAPGAARGAVAGQAAGATVLVVDDSMTVRRVTQRLLERNGYHVVTAKDGVDALREMGEEMPAVMLVDVEMPRMDGYDLTRNVRGAAALRAVPIIMITSRTAEKHRRVAMELGADEYLGKPYREDELLELVRRYATEGRPAGAAKK